MSPLPTPPTFCSLGGPSGRSQGNFGDKRRGSPPPPAPESVLEGRGRFLRLYWVSRLDRALTPSGVSDTAEEGGTLHGGVTDDKGRRLGPSQRLYLHTWSCERALRGGCWSMQMSEINSSRIAQPGCGRSMT